MVRTVDFTACIQRQNLKSFSNILHFLLKVDAELIIEASPTGMWLRALNDAKSAFVVVELCVQEFFSSFRVSSHGEGSGGDDTNDDTASNVFSCKIFGKVGILFCLFFIDLPHVLFLPLTHSLTWFGLVLCSRHL